MLFLLPRMAAALVGLVVVAGPAVAQTTIGDGQNSTEDPQVVGLGGWTVEPIWTVGEAVRSYVPPGIPDGTGAFALNGRIVRVFVNHELNDDSGYQYRLANGTQLTGARVSFFDINRVSRSLVRSSLAYRTIVDRYGAVVTSATQINEGTDPLAGLDRLCSANLFTAGEYGIVDDIFFTGEETGGGQEFALDIHDRILYTAPWLGRAAWESVTLLDTRELNTVAVLIGDDRGGAPLLLYVGVKDPTGGFLERNGLAGGTLFVWVADSGETTPDEWNGTGTVRPGQFIPIRHYDPLKAGAPGYDAQGFADQDTQDALAAARGAFRFSRPEDVSTNPADGSQAVLASTGRGGLFPADNWGTTYLVDVDFGTDLVVDGQVNLTAQITAELTVLYDGDDAGDGAYPDPDFGLRSPDNLDWADDGFIYVQEDRSTSPSSLFGGTSGEEASIWRLDPTSPTVFTASDLVRIAQIDIDAVPDGQRENEPQPNERGVRETSGVLDVTSLFKTRPGETLLLADVQAHDAIDGPIVDGDLVQGGQLVLLSNQASSSVLAPAVGASLEAAPAADALLAPAPNPARDRATVGFELAEAGDVTVAVFDALGREVARLLDGPAEAGVQEVTFDAAGLPAGVYVVRMTTGTGTFAERITVVR
ncbi:T9SS type A sorting domain-containing protein [Rubrivirga sp.]|uniref:T9SS type A sorting domain-containing protein n=1 Tax=Rubrivirga sp. TaxID=1885344 RepID=UPI003B516E18